MAVKPETVIVDAIQAWVETHHGNVLKLNGNAFQRKGEPDLIGGIPVLYKGTPLYVHFAVEAKIPGEKPEKLQLVRLERWRKVGFWTTWVTSLDAFIAFIKQAAYGETLPAEAAEFETNFHNPVVIE